MGITGPSAEQQAQRQQQQQRLQQLQEEQRAIETQLRVQQYASQYEIELQFPAKVVVNGRAVADSSPSAPVNPELIQHRLLEAGVLYEVPTSIRSIVASTTSFVQDLEATGCFDTVRVEIGSPGKLPTQETVGLSGQAAAEPSGPPTRHLKVLLNQARWYRLHIGGGLKTDSLINNPEQQALSASSVFGGNTGGAVLPTAELDASITLRNLTGYLDTTSLQYTLDTRSIATIALDHQRPLYSIFPKDSDMRNNILSNDRGSQYSFQTRFVLDTVDYEFTRSYKEFQRLLSVRATNQNRATARGDSVPSFFTSLEWKTLLRDIVPRRHATIPFAYNASHPIVQQSGPSVKHAFVAEMRSNGAFVNQRDDDVDGAASLQFLNPTSGLEFHSLAELATPPGDVGFFKFDAGLSLHRTLFYTQQTTTSDTDRKSGVALHGALNTGYLHPLSFGGLCGPPTISDRFFVGGPFSLRGFLPAGIGPRSHDIMSESSGTTPRHRDRPGDALGGDFYYTATAMLSMSPRILESVFVEPKLQETVDADGNRVLVSTESPLDAFRVFGFVNVGTCVGSVCHTPLSAIMGSTRTSVGVGLATALLGPRLEVTCAWPLRYGPKDVRRNFQFGMGFTFG